jgi:predicted PolB exonuclease-like 3'-5' exonuclease
MEKKKVKKFLKKNNGYLKWGAEKLADFLGTTPEIINEIRDHLKDDYQYYNPGSKVFKRLFFDIETSYNIGKFWSAGWNKTITPKDIIHERSVICISWKWEGEDKVHNLKWDKNQCDKTMLEKFSKIIAKADEVIGHNGDRFDIKWLRTRCLYHRIAFPTYIRSLDTLKKVRSMFNFQSNKLDYIANFLGFGHKVETGGLELWDDIILRKDEKAMEKMLEYCDHDVVLLEDVYRTISSYIKPNTHVGKHLGNGKASCPNCGSKDTMLVKNVFTPTGTLKRKMQCKCCSQDYEISNTAYLNM